MPDDPIAIVRACFDAYARSDRATLEPLVADDFRFTSPLDNGLDRKTYFARCWPNNESIAGFEFERIIADGETVFVEYTADTSRGRFRNAEVHTVRDGRIVAVEVYFGWSLPHPAAPGGFVTP